MKLYPAFINLSGKNCLVVGSGPQALRASQVLAASDAKITLVSTNAPEQIEHVTNLHRRDFQATDLEGQWIVVAASANPQLNKQIVNLCDKQQILCTLPDQHEDSSLIAPSVIDRSPLQIAITSGSGSAVLASALKTRLESLIPAAYSRLTRIIDNHLGTVKAKLPDKADRTQFWHKLINGPLGELGYQADDSQLNHAIESAVAALDSPEEPVSTGQVALVGAGPGDPDLLTFRALRLVQSGDVIVYDRLVSKTILDLCRSDAEFIYAGKAKADHAIPQDAINQLLVDLAKSGKNVVRLKGGDPFIFGRGGEEIETLAENQVSFQVVPGITAAAGCASFSGIPLTHRDHAQSCVFVTGHLRNGEPNLNFKDLQDPTQTIVVYMGLTGLAAICSALIRYGRDTDTPAALIEHGTTPEQRVLSGTIATLPKLVASSDVSAPTLLIIGGVVTLRDKLKWFESSKAADLTIT